MDKIGLLSVSVRYAEMSCTRVDSHCSGLVSPRGQACGQKWPFGGLT